MVEIFDHKLEVKNFDFKLSHLTIAIPNDTLCSTYSPSLCLNANCEIGMLKCAGVFHE